MEHLPVQAQNHHVAVMRRSGAVLIPSDTVGPGEEVVLYATDVANQSVHAPEFVVQDIGGAILLDIAVGAGTLTGVAMTAWRAPEVEGSYTFTVHAQSFPFLPFTHEVSTQFQVRADAPPPPSPPPSTGIGNLLDQLPALLGIMALFMVMPMMQSLTQPFGRDKT